MAVFPFLARLRRRAPSPAAITTYAIACACGNRLAGERHARTQTVRCPGCGRDHFVLPKSPLPPPARDPIAAASGKVKRSPRLLLPLLLFGVLLTTLAVVFALVINWGGGGRPPQTDPLTDLPRHQARGLVALGDGNFQLAVQELGRAVALAEHFAASVPASERTRLDQLFRQAALLADLLHEPLAVLLQLAAGVPEQEWQAVFARTYRHKAVVFDAAVRRVEDGRYEMSYVVADGRRVARLHLEDLALLHGLPLAKPQRLLFGARLADVVREPDGSWGVRFAPGSGVLLTEAAAAEACLFVPPDDALQEVLERQATWLREKR